MIAFEIEFKIVEHVFFCRHGNCRGYVVVVTVVVLNSDRGRFHVVAFVVSVVLSNLNVMALLILIVGINIVVWARKVERLKLSMVEGE